MENSESKEVGNVPTQKTDKTPVNKPKASSNEGRIEIDFVKGTITENGVTKTIKQSNDEWRPFDNFDPDKEYYF